MHIEPLTPITNVLVLQGVPLDTSYTDTISFANSTSQYDYFITKTKYNFTDLTPVKIKNAIRLPVPADNLYDCNYVMWQNKNFSNKWFYGFITDIIYINPAMCEINIEIDVLQTWQFDYQIKKCFVEREMTSVSEVAGDNLVPENLELGEYVYESFSTSEHIDDKAYVVACTCDGNGDDINGATYCGLYSGLYFNVFYTPDDVKTYLDLLTTKGKSAGIVSVFVMPADFVAVSGGPQQFYFVEKSKQTALGSYIPRNKKLLTFPYQFLYVTDLNGNSANFRYEFFGENVCKFTELGDMSCNPSVLLAPMYYKGLDINWNEKIVMGGFPQLAYNTDAFKAYLAQNAGSIAINTLSSVLSIGTGVVNGVGVAAGLFGIANTMSQVVQHSIQPPQAGGNTGATAQYALHLKEFTFYPYHITEDFAKRIDEFFDMFGYATNRLKVPNTNNRPQWNFVKTKNCKLTGSIPFKEIEKIKVIYDNGLTIWHTTDVGNYSLNNRG